MGKFLLVLAWIGAMQMHTLHAIERGRDGESSVATIKGVVSSQEDNSPVSFATLHIEGTNIGTSADDKGRFHLRVPAGEQTLVVSYIGRENYSQVINTVERTTTTINITLSPSSTDIQAVEVEGESKSRRINKTSYYVQSMEMDGFKNSSANMTDALSKIGGVKIREAGGVGSETTISLNGYSGNHVKIFIDGVQLDQNNSAFSLSNMPATFADRIDVYSGVVPIEFGTDAIGGVINIISNKELKYQALNLDVSYSYGSFNTHQSYINFGQVLKNGLTYNINFYQNYSDNDYYVYDEIVKFTGSGTGSLYKDYSDTNLYRNRRFHDGYHNESVLATLGVANKSWADILTLKINYSQYENEVQTGVIQDVVYGDKMRTGYSITPTLDYSKEDLIVKGLDLKISSNLSTGYTENSDPGVYSYNWAGDKAEDPGLSSTFNESKNFSLNANAVVMYELSESHDFTLSHNYSTSSRITRSKEDGTDAYGLWDLPSASDKNISGASYRYHPGERFDASVFAKYYIQASDGYTTVSEDDATLVYSRRKASSLGYGVAGSYFIIKGLQAKASFEKAYRLPTSTEMFGDNDLEVGTFTLQPETSYNYNLGVSYRFNLFKHNKLVVDASLVYRDTRDYISRTVGNDYATYENFGKVETKGYTLSLRYDYKKLLSVGGTFNNLDTRNAEKGLYGGTDQVTVTYGLRLPNTPYIYANGDAALNFYDLFAKGDGLTVGYDLFYQYEFPLYWESIGYKETKQYVPSQLSHSIMVNYSFQKSKYNLTLEAKNIMDANLYDNYSLQKPGRAFYATVRVNINKRSDNINK